MKSLTVYLEDAIKKNQLIIEECNNETDIDDLTIDEPSIINPPDLSISKIPTLQPDVYREFSPLLKIRYEMFSSWILAPHGNWLSLNEMQELWQDDDNSSEYITDIKEQLLASKEWWGNDATALFKDERISIFAAEEFGNERIYLIWFDDIDEPELWVYDENGEARYENIEQYLKAYLNDDLENYSKPWILGTITTESIEKL